MHVQTYCNCWMQISSSCVLQTTLLLEGRGEYKASLVCSALVYAPASWNAPRIHQVLHKPHKEDATIITICLLGHCNIPVKHTRCDIAVFVLNGFRVLGLSIDCTAP